MNIGQERDKRKFIDNRKLKDNPVVGHISDKIPAWPKCECCGMNIVNRKKYRGSESGKWLCNRCFNEPR